MNIQEHNMKNIGVYKYNRKNNSTENHKKTITNIFNNYVNHCIAHIK